MGKRGRREHIAHEPWRDASIRERSNSGGIAACPTRPGRLPVDVHCGGFKLCLRCVWGSSLSLFLSVGRSFSLDALAPAQTPLPWLSRGLLVGRAVSCGGGREAFSCYSEPHLPPGQGSITTRELGQLLRALGKNPTQDELTKLFQKVDPQQEGAVKFETFVNCMLEPMKQPGALS